MVQSYSDFRALDPSKYIDNVSPGRTATIVVAALNSSLQSKAQADFVCDGIADNVEIQAAINALPAGGGKVVLSEGLYSISAPPNIPSYVWLQGSGLGTTRLKRAIDNISVLCNQNKVGGNIGIKVSDLQIDGSNAPSTADIIDFDYVKDSVIENVYLHHFNPGSIDWRGINIGWPATFGISINCSVKNCIVSDGGGSAIGVDGIGHIITDNFVRNMGGEGIEVDTASSFCTIAHNIVTACNSVHPVGAIELDSGSFRCIVQGNIIYNTGACGIRCMAAYDNIIANNIVDRHTSDGISFGEASYRNVITGNKIRGGQYGIYESADSHHFLIIGNYCGEATIFDIDIRGNNNLITNNFFKNLRDLGTGNIWSNKHSDIFMDVLAVSANHVVNAQTLAANPTVCALAAQPDVPRTLSYTITHPTLTAFTLTFVGVNAKGQVVTEVFTQAAGWTGETSNAFATVTSITMSAMTGNTVADTIDVGITDVLGLSNKIYATSDVYKIKKNNANALVAVAQVNVTYDTYDMVVIGLAVGDDFTIWFRSNLNFVS